MANKGTTRNPNVGPGSAGDCEICRRRFPLESLHVVHLGSPFTDGRPDDDHLCLVCPECHLALDSGKLTEREFNDFLESLIEGNRDFGAVVHEPIKGPDGLLYRPDFLVQDFHRSSPPLLIESKVPRHASSAAIHSAIDQITRYAHAFGKPCRKVLAIPLTLPIDLQHRVSSAGIELWDLDFIIEHFKEEIDRAPASIWKSTFLSAVSRRAASREDELIEELRACQKGKGHWSTYQSLIGDILEHLFVPPLTKPLREHADSVKVNRRDFILPNYASDGFWHFLRQRYTADYVVVDAKNYTGLVGKKDVLQMGNYLKAQGTGLFGIIISRCGGDRSGCQHTRRELFFMHHKLIVILSDLEVELMLLAKKDGKSPEDVIGTAIERFRLSL